ncbi:MAG TPA: glycosyltransferase family 2 protein [Pararhodobacter sp.]|nr:glycosyltransferase family 2 protein [Paracoccaceae bacterium]HPD91602.1 glycosyltransferase family 2 protein [Pararhodobacter sp.]
MHPFGTAQGARFHCRADFRADAVLNLNFFDAERAQIPFHLSLRRDERLAVVNRRDAQGWRREIRIPLDLEARGIPVEIHFAGAAVDLWVDGQHLGRFDAMPRPSREGRMFLRRGFPDLRRIAWLDIHGTLEPGSALFDSLETRATGRTGLHLTDSIEITLRGLSSAQARGAVLAVPGLEAPIPTTRRSLPFLLADGGAEQEILAVLPGRIWAGDTATLDLRMTGADGAVLGRMTLDRADLGRRIATLAQAGGLAADDRAALQAIEHVRHAGLLDALPVAARRALFDAAARFRLGDYLAEGSQPEPPPRVPGPDPDALPAAAAERFSGRMRAAPASDPVALLKGELAVLPDSETRLSLMQRVTEWFCLTGRMADLMALRRLFALPLPPTPDPGNLWLISVQLPALLDARQTWPMVESLRRLAVASRAWVSTPPLAAVVIALAQARPADDGWIPPAGHRIEGIVAFLDFLDARAPDYWERTPCRMLIAATVALLRASGTLPLDLRERVQWRAIAIYALSPAFWQALADLPDDRLPWRFRVLRQGFADLRALIETDGPRDTDWEHRANAALHLFETVGAVGLDRFRREMFAPSGLPSSDTTHGLGLGLDPGEGALRRLAWPLSDAPIDSPALPEGLARANPQVHSAPLRDHARALNRAAHAVLAGPGKGDVAALADALPTLMSDLPRYLGLTLGLSTARGLLDQARQAEAETLLSRLVGLSPTLGPPEAWPPLAEASVPAQALHALATAHPHNAWVRRAVQALAHRLPPTPEAPGATPADTRGDDRAGDLYAAASPVQDTLLCLYSCRPNLDTRVSVLRQTWLPLLADMGVPVLIFVGGGDGRREGDVVHLQAPDDYEGLPQKSLALARWVLEHTRFGHMVKVDDDCFLDPAAWFGDLAHRRYDYYGRRLHRVRGQMDRTWHMAKSQSARGRLELDKSPEPSTYADGGSGYALSRAAMQALCRAADSPEGQGLTRLSFMEDKLVGDLLALSGIAVESADYQVSVLRRTRPGGPLVAQWENGFLPFAGGGVKLAHLDGVDKMAEVLAGLRAARPQPRKVWPSFQPARLGSWTNALDLVSAPDRLARAIEAEVAVVACMRNERFLLPRFLDHYRALGVTGFLIADNGSDDGSFEYLADQPDVALFAVDTDYSQSTYGVAWQQALMANFRPGRWTLAADADELLFWSRDLSGSLPDLVRSPEFAGADAARVFMLDMYPQGPLAEADFRAADPFAQAGFVDRTPFLAVSGSRGPYSDAPVWTSALRHRLIPGSRAELFVAQKVALLKYRPWMRLSAGLHFVSDTRLAQRDLLFGHFKYNAAFHAKAEAEVARAQHFNNAEEYRKYLALVSEGRDRIHDPAVSVPWQTCEFVQRICAGKPVSA